MNSIKDSQEGMTLIELLLAGSILTISSMGIVGLLFSSVLTNNRNKINSAQIMVAESIVEHVSSTLIGTGDSTINDCDGHSYTVGTIEGGANLTTAGDEIDFTEDIAANTSKADYHMDYHLNTPCTSSGALMGTYDVRWNVQRIGGSVNPTNTYLLTVSSRMKNGVDGGIVFPKPVTLRLMSGN